MRILELAELRTKIVSMDSQGFQFLASNTFQQEREAARNLADHIIPSGIRMVAADKETEKFQI